jgi:hypothetical protein
MDEPLKETFVQEMRDAIQKQMLESEQAKRKEEHDAKLVADEGPKKWHELKNCLVGYADKINEGLPNWLLNYRENVSGSEFTLKNELSGRDVQIVFDPASAVISYAGNKEKGVFRPFVQGDGLEYGWERTPARYVLNPGRKFRGDDDEHPLSFSTNRMSEIIIRCAVEQPPFEA